MKTKTRNMFISIFSALLLCSCALFLFFAGAFSLPSITTVNADEGTLALKNPIKDETFYFSNGAALNIQDFADSKYTLGFKVNLSNPKHTDLYSYESNHLVSNFWGTFLKDSEFKYSVTIMQDNGEGAQPTPLARLYFIYEYVYANARTYLTQAILRENVTFYSESIEVPEHFIDSVKTDWQTIDATMKKPYEEMLKETGDVFSSTYGTNVECLSFGYFEKSGGFFYDDGADKDNIFTVSVNSAFQSYFVRFEYNYRIHSTRDFWGSNHYSRFSGAIDSETRCVANVVSNMYEQGGEDEIASAFDGNEKAIALAKALLTSEKQTVRIKYLEDVEGTPFARAVYENVEVPVISGGVYMDDVIAYKKTLEPEFEAFKALDSTAYNIELSEDEENVYRINYLKNVVVQTITVDGEYCESYLDINLSYADFYQPLILDEILRADTFEYVYSTSILSKYPQLSGYTMDEIHGYFGFVSCPEVITFESVISDMFVDYKKSTCGIIEGHYYKKDINTLDYVKLMRAYGYTYTDTFWSYMFTGFWDLFDVVTGSEVFPANFYVFYSMPGTSKAVIAEGGQTSIDDGSALDIEVSVVTKKIGSEAFKLANKAADNTQVIIIVVIAIIGGYLLIKVGPAFSISGSGARKFKPKAKTAKTKTKSKSKK